MSDQPSGHGTKDTSLQVQHQLQEQKELVSKLEAKYHKLEAGWCFVRAHPRGLSEGPPMKVCRPYSRGRTSGR